MSEVLASLRKKGGKSIESNLFATNLLVSNSTSWTTQPVTGTVNDPNSSAVAVMLDPDFGHFDSNGAIVVDKATKAYITGRAFTVRNTAGTAIYMSIRVQINGTTLTGASVTASSGTLFPYFRRVQVNLAVGDKITVQTKASASVGQGPTGLVNIVTDD